MAVNSVLQICKKRNGKYGAPARNTFREKCSALIFNNGFCQGKA